MNLTYRIAQRYLQAQGALLITGQDRLEHLDDVWAMYTATYRAIGLHIPDPRGLLRYGIWKIGMDGDSPVAFNLSKKTRYGYKAGLGGFDPASSQGKRAMVHSLRTQFKLEGNYGEVSHKVASIVLSAGAPVVCAAYVGGILGKPIEVTEDGVHYRRSLGGLGVVEKIMVGRPKGTPVTNFDSPSCPAKGKAASPEGLSEMNLAEHVASLVL